LPKDLTISISDELAEKMDMMPEINWSEVCRQAIIKYIDERKKGWFYLRRWKAGT